MCTLSDVGSDSDIDDIDEEGNLGLESSANTESDQQLVLTGQDLNDLDDGINDALSKAFSTKMNTLPRYRSNLMDKAAAIIKNNLDSGNGTKVADVIAIEGGGPVHVGHIIHITEQLVLNTENNEENCERPMKVYPSDTFPIVKRMMWLAQPSVAEIEYLEEPAKFVIICHTATEEGFSQAENVLLLRLMQTFHIESRGWRDIAYNFCIGSDGNVYEGRGWFQVGSHTVSYNKTSIGIAFIGCFLNKTPPRGALKKCQDLIAHGVKIGSIRPDYQLIAHCQCRPFLSPGPAICEEIKSWMNFNPDFKP